jgi:hypothetical protein
MEIPEMSLSCFTLVIFCLACYDGNILGSDHVTLTLPMSLAKSHRKSNALL